jgi:hypothetical protein
MKVYGGAEVQFHWLFTLVLGVISGFRREVDEICVHLGYYAAYSGKSLQTFREKPIGPETSVSN